MIGSHAHRKHSSIRMHESMPAHVRMRERTLTVVFETAVFETAVFETAVFETADFETAVFETDKITMP